MIRVHLASLIALAAMSFSGPIASAGHPHLHCHSHRHVSYSSGWSVSGIGISVGYSPIYAYSSSWNACYRPSISYGYYSPAWHRSYYAPSYYSPTYYRSYYAPGCSWGWYGANSYASPGYSYAFSAAPTNFASRPRDPALVEHRWLAAGDAAFRAGRYLQALGDYRRAEEAGYAGADLLHRKAHAYVAAGQYRLASSAFKQAFKADGNIDRSFSLDELYGRNTADKTAHMERLAESAAAKADDFDAYYLLGIMLHYNGEAARAEKFFAAAERLPEARSANIASFRSPGRPVFSSDDITPIVAERPVYVGGKDT